MNEQQIEQLKQKALSDLAKVTTSEDFQNWEIKYFGRKQGLLILSLKQLPSLSDSLRRELGPRLNELRSDLEKAADQKRIILLSASSGREFSEVDVTLPGTKPEVGNIHPLSRTRRELEDIFTKLGFTALEGPELETDYYNFEALNIPKGHPARDMWDTFFITPKVKSDKNQEEMLLRTHTSPMQIRLMEKYKPSFAVIIPGRTYRRESTDARHEHTFDQLEGLMVGERISVANLKYVLKTALSEFFGKNLKMQLRPSYFPFVEPGFEVAVSCTICGGGGCSVCSQGWLELLGAGMVHPKVFEFVGYPPGKYTGFAFGMGINRFAMIKHAIPDIRLFAENDLKFLTL